MLQHHPVTGAAPRAELYPAADVLAKIHNRVALRRAENALCRKTFLPADTTSRLRAQRRKIPLRRRGASPPGIVKTGQLPARYLQPGIIRFTVVYFRKQHRRIGAFPEKIGGDRPAAAVGKKQFQLHQQSGAFAVIVAQAEETHRPLEPAGADHRSDRVSAAGNQVCHVIGLHQQMCAVRSPAGGQFVAADPFAVEVQTVQTERRAVNHR